VTVGACAGGGGVAGALWAPLSFAGSTLVTVGPGVLHPTDAINIANMNNHLTNMTNLLI